MGKIAFFDIYGTLYGYDGKEHKIPKSTKVAIKRFRENGNVAFVCTGRPMRFIYQILGSDMFDGYISANGTYIVYNEKCILNKSIDVETIKKLKRAFNELEIGGSFVGPFNGYAYNMKCDEIQKYNLQFKGEKYLVEDWKDEEISVNALDIFYSNELHLNRCKDYFKDDLIFNTHGAHMSADVSFKDFNKGDSIKYVADFLNSSLDETIAFGDGYNDITMFKAAKTGIAMGNAVEELKEIASFVTNNIFDDGIYNAMIEYGFI